MRKAVWVAAGAAGAALVATASVGPATPSGAAPATRTIHVTARLLVGEELDLGATCRSVGDQVVFSGSLLSVAHPDRRVARIGGYCVIDDLQRNAGQCTMTATLVGGQITVQGEQEAIPTPRTVANTITGGTGVFRRARGEMTQKFLTPASATSPSSSARADQPVGRMRCSTKCVWFDSSRGARVPRGRR